MWGGLHFFVDINALLTFERGVKPDDLKGKPGRPQQMVLKEADGTLSAATSYPAVALLLSTLKATGNLVHVFAPWPPSRTRDVTAMFGWRPFITDVRACHSLPGQRYRTLGSLGCAPMEYARSVVITSEPGNWNPQMASQVVAVEHERTEELLREYEGGTGSNDVSSGTGVGNVADSMELVLTLCRCITLAEWQVRVPATPVAASAALTAANVFGSCRFFVPVDVLSIDFALLLSAHGATIVDTEATATHVVYRSPNADAEPTGCATSDTDSDTSSPPSTSSSGSSGTSPATGADSSYDSTDSDDPSDHNNDVEVLQGKGTTMATIAASTSPPANENATVAAAAAAAEAPILTTALPTTSNPGAQLVTRIWVRACCRAQRLLPVPSPADVIAPRSSNGVMSVLRTTGALLTALLPPVDAKPLPWLQFVHICEAHLFPTAPFSGSSLPSLYGVLVGAFRTVAIVRQVSASARKVPASARSISKELPATTLVLCRHERKRDRDAVGEHQKLAASQFAFSLELVRRERFALHCASTGTQTSRPRFAHAAVATDPITVHVVDAGKEMADTASETECKAESGPVERAQENAKAALAADGAAYLLSGTGVDEEEWKTHLKNAEGKVLKSSAGFMPHADHEEKLAISATDGSVTWDATCDDAAPSSPAGPAERQGVHNTHSSTESIFQAPPALYTLPLTDAPGSCSRQTSLFAAPPLFPSGPSGRRDSIFPMPDLHLLTSDPPAATATAVTTATTTRCVIDVRGLLTAQRKDLFQYLQILPMFSPYSSTARVEEGRAGDVINCIFATPKEASDFAKLSYMDFGGTHHTISLAPAEPEREPGGTDANAILPFPESMASTRVDSSTVGASASSPRNRAEGQPNLEEAISRTTLYETLAQAATPTSHDRAVQKAATQTSTGTARETRPLRSETPPKRSLPTAMQRTGPRSSNARSHEHHRNEHWRRDADGHWKRSRAWEPHNCEANRGGRHPRDQGHNKRPPPEK